MRVIQTFYISKGKQDLSYAGSFLSPEFNWMSWALSCLSISKFYPIELYTNTAGKEILIDKLKLPYTKVHLDFDNYESIDERLWSLIKVFTYSLQESPFIHIDGDVFLWQELGDDFLNSAVCCQNIELDHVSLYKIIFEKLMGSKDAYMHPALREIYGEGRTYAYNAGLFGGRDIPFIKEYTNEAFRLANFNKRIIADMSSHIVGMLNVLLEQGILYCLAQEKNIQVAEYITFDKEDVWAEFNFADFLGVSSHTTFIHLIGTKHVVIICQMLAKQLRKDFPEYFHRILALCEAEGVDTLVKNNNTILPIEGPYKILESFAQEVCGVSQDASIEEIMLLVNDKEKLGSHREAFQDLLNFVNARINYQNRYLGTLAIDNDEEQYNLIDSAFLDNSVSPYITFSLNERAEFIDTCYVWTKYVILEEYKKSEAVTGNYKIAFTINPLFKKVESIFCDELVVKVIEMIENKKNYGTIMNELYSNYYDTHNQSVDFELLDGKELYHHIEQLMKHYIFTGLINIVN